MELTKEKQIQMYRTMVKIRVFEENVGKLFASGFIPGFVHLYIGEEAVAVGACSALEKDDYITSTHRGHGHLIAKGGILAKMMAELFGKKTGYCKGKGGSMHIADVDLGILGANGIVGAGLTIAPGAALSAKMRGTKQVAVCFFGDGASNRGTFHEALNMSAVWKLPVVFVCENNKFGMGTPQKLHMNIEDVADRAVAYGIPGVAVDGNDLFAVYEAVSEAVKRARKGDGPSLIECKTYRFRGHTEGDPGTTYRTQEDVEEAKKFDPLVRVKEALVNEGVATEAELQAIHEEIVNEVEAAVEFAKESPLPEPEEALEDVYAMDCEVCVR